MHSLPTTTLDKEFIASMVKPRDPQAHKGNHGHAFLIAGNTGRMGAAVLSARACLRTGAGLLTVNVPKDERIILQVAVPEAMLTMRGDNGLSEKYTAIGIGPAFGLQEENLKLLQHIFESCEKPLVLDADALTLLATHRQCIANIPKDTIFTPHSAEFDRLFDTSVDPASRLNKAIQLSLTHPWIIVLKGHRTVIAANGNTYTNTTGNAGLAKGGSGDVLTGMILALLAQGYRPADAACIGVYLHGLAADIAVKEESPESLLASDVIDCIGHAFTFLRY